MAKKVTLDNLASEVKKILDEYGDDVYGDLDEITRKVGRKGVQALKNESLAKFPSSGKHKKRYGQYWTSKAEKNRLYTRVIIYSNQPGLPHLLENGHAKVNGGRVPGRAHISPIEEQLVTEFETEVTRKL